MKEQRWVIAKKGADFREISRNFGIDPLTARLIRNRDVIGNEEIRKYLNGTKEDLFDPFGIKDINKAVDIISKKVAGGAKIRIIGDYDIDGVMGSYILKQALQKAGACVSVDIPDRFTDGYGMSIRMIEKAHSDGVDTIVTVDNGIDAMEPIDEAKKRGMTVIVTDHHEVKSLPVADAVVDIKREDCPYQNKDICGAALAYKFMQALYEHMGLPAEKIDDLLQYAAFATIGDIVELKGENRIIVKEGMKILRKTDNEGLKELCRACGVNIAELDSYHIGFILGPCINASGRLHLALESLELLESSGQEAEKIAERIRQYNDERKYYTDEGFKKAAEIVEEKKLYDKKVIVVYVPECHEAVAGIVASRIKDLYYRPSLVMTGSGEFAKGSARATEDYHMFSELSKCRDILVKFGGHKMAAGFTLRTEDIDELERRLNEYCSLTEEEMKEKVVIDAEMPFSYVTEKLVNEIESLAPFGKGNSKPLFAARNVMIESPDLVGENKNVLRCRIRTENGRRMQAVCFDDAVRLYEYIVSGNRPTVAYYPTINEYGGYRSIQAVIKNFLM